MLALRLAEVLSQVDWQQHSFGEGSEGVDAARLFRRTLNERLGVSPPSAQHSLAPAWAAVREGFKSGVCRVPLNTCVSPSVSPAPDWRAVASAALNRIDAGQPFVRRSRNIAHGVDDLDEL